jgi:uncharacterized membrane-anchored protein YitT (DUF2179 family)
MQWTKQYRQVVPILIGTAIYAFGLHYFIIPNEFMEGGITGISLLLHYVLQIPPSLTTLLLNLPLFYVGWRFLGKGAMIYTILGVLALSFFLWVMELLILLNWVQPFHSTDDLLLATLYAGVTLGTGLGIVFRYGGTTGGTDIIARMGNKFKGWSMGQMLLTIDVIVIATSLLYIPLEKVLYTMVIVFIAARVIDFIQEGAYAAKAFNIITDHPESVTAAISLELDRGVTLYQARGGYSKKAKEVVYCVVYKHESRRMQLLVKQVDPLAFIVINDVHDVLGEGFKIEAAEQSKPR